MLATEVTFPSRCALLRYYKLELPPPKADIAVPTLTRSESGRLLTAFRYDNTKDDVQIFLLQGTTEDDPFSDDPYPSDGSRQKLGDDAPSLYRRWVENMTKWELCTRYGILFPINDSGTHFVVLEKKIRPLDEESWPALAEYWREIEFDPTFADVALWRNQYGSQPSYITE